MNAGVRATSTCHGDGVICNQREGLLEELLYARAGFLALPAVICGPVVLNAERDANYY